MLGRRPLYGAQTLTDMKAIGKNIVIRKIDEDVKTESGLLLSATDVSDFRYHKGEVLNVGTDVKGVSNGDMVYYDTRNAYTLVISGEAVTIIQEHAVVVVL